MKPMLVNPPPVSAAEMGIMLDLVTKMIAVEEQNKRLSVEIKAKNKALWAGVVAALFTSITAIVTALLK